MTLHPKVSIIIPVYNGSNYLREAIDSALAQTYENTEVIVINDGSNDGGQTEAVARSYADKVRYFSKENGGVSSALNLGIREAEGEHISWLSHDDAYLPDKVKTQVEHVRDTNRGTIFFSDYEIMDENSNFVRNARMELVDGESMLFNLLVGWPVHGCTTLIPKACFDQVGLFNEANKRVQDYEQWFKFLRAGCTFKHVPKVLAKFRVHQQQDSVNREDSHYQEREETYLRALELFKDDIRAWPAKEIAKVIVGLRRTKGLPEAAGHALMIPPERFRIKLMVKLEDIKHALTLRSIYRAIARYSYPFRLSLRKGLDRFVDRYVYFLKVARAKNKSKCILVVAMADSIHTVRWLNQVGDRDWDIHLFPSVDIGEQIHAELANVTVYQSVYGRSPSMNRNVTFRGLFLPGRRSLAILSRKLLNGKFPGYRQQQLKRLIYRLKPDVVHSLEFQKAGYLTLEAKKQLGKRFPQWIATNWGSDIYLFGRLKEHAPRIKELLATCDYYSCECRRDVNLARGCGLKGEVLPVFPNTGGFDLDKVIKLRQPGRTSERRLIMLKGYQGWVGRALVGLRALERCADLLEGYTIAIYLAGPEMKVAAELFTGSTGIPIQIIPHTSQDDILRFHGRARISIGVNISDAVSTSFLEALVMGSFPIQTNTSSADEWIEDGATGILIPPEDPEVIEKAVRRALTDDDLVDKAAELNWQTAVERLDYHKIKQQTIEFYERVFDAEKVEQIDDVVQIATEVMQ